MNKILRAVFGVLFIGVCVIVFGFSSQNGDVSGGLSEKIADFVVSVANIGEIRIDPSHDSEGFDKVHFFVRKLAHFSIYASLGFSACGFLLTFALKAWQRIAFSGIACFLYACTDEFHQSFVLGRGPSFRDVLIDSAGAIFGICVIIILSKICIKIWQKKRNKISI